jgi:hypothetical protein
MPDVPNLNTTENMILEYLSTHKLAIEGIERYIQTVSSYKNILQSALVYMMLDAGIYDFEITKEKAIDVAHYDLVVKPNEESVVLSIVFPNQKVEDVL